MTEYESRQVTDIPVLPQTKTEEEIDLSVLFTVLWRAKWFIIACTLFFAIAGGIYAFMKPDIYRADVLLTPTTTDSGSQLESVASRLGGLASLAGIGVGSGSSGVQKALYALQVLQSRKFIGNFIQKHDLLVPLMAAKGWDKENGELIYNSDMYDVKHHQWASKEGRVFKPKLLVATHYFKREILQIDIDTEAKMVTVSIDFYSPYIAQQWVNWLVEDLNHEIRFQDMTDAQNSIDYLNQQVLRTSLADTRSMLYQLIEQQTKKLMLTKVHQEYVLKTVDPAVVAAGPAKPRRLLYIAVACVLGGFIAVLMVFIRQFIRNNRKN
ncbi:Wzz/FepE/Etk N-terminal domain-containing protein [Vibrio mangrovi]|uniref:Cryptic autophosphorylating protein tyrosine kinase Etk n=1 Tax=Vibrio mangrovi TaxID=474394 RepID=A0A1Y6IV18_9VIBR|nr:Wzz/FepE/Etk N-terminal domain-containing protein [Vibrio mangrovi]MDW6002174.1 Wzz/FepE/Etk N-terminal domain-containing protein [Vibrio mangrovi]SMS01519.1 cryptic autophosphorylating protein tyrosine kinase Etk [Vibrio mangrovi]